MRKIVALVVVLGIVLVASMMSCRPTINGVPQKKLWQPPNSWEQGDGYPPGYDGVDLSKWRK